MICTEKEQMTCNSEKQGCNGCYYNKCNYVNKDFNMCNLKLIPINNKICKNCEIRG